MRLSVLGLMVVAGVAQADPAAEALFREGRDLLKAGKVDEACDRFARSQVLEPKVGTAFNLGDCREHQGHLADAWEAFVTSHALASRDNDNRGVLAQQRAAALEPRLAHLKIVVAGQRPAGLAITRNGAPVASEVLDTEIPVDPGDHELVATAPGFLSRSTRVALALGAHETATIAALEVDPNAPRPIMVEPGIWPPLQHLAVGAAFGGTSDSDITGGVRVIGSYPVPHGAVRATLQGLFNKVGAADQSETLNHYKLSLGLDYLWPWGRNLASAGGLAIGKTFVDDSYQNGHATDNATTWFALQLSPLIVRFGRPDVEVGLHVMWVVTETMPGFGDVAAAAKERSATVVGILGLDWFVW